MSLDTSVVSSINPVTSKIPSALGGKLSIGEGDQYIPLEADVTWAQKNATDATKERNHMGPKILPPACQIADPIKRKPIVSRAGEEKRLSRKIRRALEKEQKTADQQELVSSEVTENERESKRLLSEYPQAAKFNISSSKHKLPENSDYNQLNRSIQLGTSSNDSPCSIIIMPIISSSITAPEHTQTNLLGCSTDLALTLPSPGVDTSDIGSKRRGSHGLASHFGTLSMAVEFLADRNRCYQESQRIGLTREFKDHIWDPGINMRRTVQMSITLDLNAGNATVELKQGQRLDIISRTNESMAVSMKRRNDGSHHQYHSRFGNSLPASEFADYPFDHRAKLCSSIHASPERKWEASGDGNPLGFNIGVSPGHSSAHSASQVPNPYFNLILNLSSGEMPARNAISENDEPCPPYVQGVG
ncbi:uncharacterized protein EV420DRAFT_1690077 [Desarmillaria tabescens]|uniref:Uncharacterized protein n=1 Tax=Armillaria tabescens TaxID=1929756 RepID=A0AA39N4N8_ARMTA|nr:uncharacterized protein EV420DRAFT_1690077 [Desarmillaria tabescens]KAK0457338.1 hypothetical protein EV420DRAFT_1690077 [Desarmillaria tabescens]